MSEEQSLEVRRVFEEFQDFLAPRLDCYEQAIYLYIFRHSRLVGKAEVVIGFKSARKKMAFGVGQEGTPMSESTCYKKLQSLQVKGCLRVLESERDGTRVLIILPAEMDGLVPAPSASPATTLEEDDFFNVPLNRASILRREGNRCFYCLRQLSEGNYVIEHVISRPLGDNGYRNVVAGCRSCNNQKDNMDAEDFLRLLYRKCVLNAEELEERVGALHLLQQGVLKPEI